MQMSKTNTAMTTKMNKKDKVQLAIIMMAVVYFLTHLMISIISK